MATGTVKWFSDEKGFGFVTPDEGGKDLFVHHTGINGNGFRTLAEGARVSYDAENGDKGPKAVNVTVIETGATLHTARGAQAASRNCRSLGRKEDHHDPTPLPKLPQAVEHARREPSRELPALRRRSHAALKTPGPLQ
jgi:cold shock protein